MTDRNTTASTRNDVGGMAGDVGYHRRIDALEAQFRQANMSPLGSRPALDQLLSTRASSLSPEAEKSLKVLGAFRPVNEYLITPPQDLNHSFSSDGDGQHRGLKDAVTPKLPPIQSHSPPVSPDNKALPSIATVSALSDPPLYPDDHPHRPSSRTPLFARDHHDSDDEQRPPRSPTSPSALPYPANLGITSPAQARRYWEDRMAEMKDIRHLIRQLPKPMVLANPPIDENGRRMLDRIEHPHRVVKSRATPRHPAKPKASAVASSPKLAVQAPSQRKRTPKVRTYSEVSDASAGKTNKHTRAAPSKKVEGSENKWFDLADYCPPTSSLDTSSEGLRVKWPSTLMDHSDDPDRHHLHPQEQQIAAVLRLHCGQYLFNKRKIFVAKVQSLKDGKNFGKTAAQNACPIDVNKASQLWDAFNRVGWFEREWFEKWL